MKSRVFNNRAQSDIDANWNSDLKLAILAILYRIREIRHAGYPRRAVDDGRRLLLGFGWLGRGARRWRLEF